MTGLILLSSAVNAQRAWENDNDEAFEVKTLDLAQRYAFEIKKNIQSNYICDNFRTNIDTIANSSSPENVRVRQIDTIFDSADRVGCVTY